MNRKVVRLALVSAVLGAISAQAAVNYTRVGSVTAVTPYDASFGGGTLAFGNHAPAQSVVAESFASANFAQSFKGNGEQLEGVAFFGNGAGTFSISLLDFGTTGPIDTYAEYNPVTPATVLVTSTFTMTSSPDSQLYFDFTGGSSVLLASSNYYAIKITGSGQTAGTIYRYGSAGSLYANGTGAKGATDLNPDGFAGVGAGRDASFAVYTATAVPEPSSFAALVGAMMLGVAGLRRRRAAK